MLLALAQINPKVGDFAGNVALACTSIEQAKQSGAELVVLPELATIGYPPRDLLLRDEIIERNLQALEQIAQACSGVAAVVGFVDRNATGSGPPLHNAVALCANGSVVSRHAKSLLPNYDVFDERRYFEPAATVTPCPWRSSDGLVTLLGLTVCEDLWNDEQFIDRRLYRQDPVEQLASQGVDLLISVSASPFWLGKQAQRQRIFAQQAREHGIAIAYVNQVGGNDDLVFDGASMVINREGKLVAQAATFEDDLLIVDLSSPRDDLIKPSPDETDSLIGALVLGTRDYVRKCGFSEVVLGLSGGIDSAVTAVIAARALGPNVVHGVAMPSRYSSEHSLTDARQLAENLGIDLRHIPINDMHRAAESALRPHFADLPEDVTEENIQARIRGQILMAMSNKFGWLLLSTGNKSELAVGYCTLYGDMCGGLAVISDVTKTAVYAIAERFNEQCAKEIIPARVLTKPPSAELKPDQKDQDALPDYDTLDAILLRYVEQHQSPRKIIEAGYDEAIVRDVVRRVDTNEYKRRQAAPGLKVTARAFGVGWRMPIAAQLNERI